MQVNNALARTKFLEDLRILSEERRESLEDTFVAWVVEDVVGVDIQSIIDQSIEIRDVDKINVDFFLCIDDEELLVWGKVIFSEDLNSVATKHDLEKFKQTYDKLESNTDPDDLLISISEKFNQRKNRFRKTMLFVITGTIDQEARRMLDSEMIQSMCRDDDVEFQILDLDKILAHIQIQQTPSISVTFDHRPLQRTDTNNKQSLVGYVKVKNIIDVCTNRTNSQRVFQENPREALPNTTTNREISATLQDSQRRNKFWKLNNGITATCSGINHANDAPHKYVLNNFKIVNGRQTVNSLIQNSRHIDDNVMVMLIVHEAVDDVERTQISTATNTQNPIKPADLITNDPLLRKLELDFKSHHPNWYFEIQRGGYRGLASSKRRTITKMRMLEKEHMARRWWAYMGKPSKAISMSEKDLFTPYNLSYTFNDTYAIDFIIPHIFYTLLDELDKQLKHNNSRDWGLLHLRVVKFYILATIGLTLDSVDSDKRRDILDELYSSFTNDSISELIDIVRHIFYDFLSLLQQLSFNIPELKSIAPHNEVNDQIQNPPSHNDVKRYLVNSDDFFVYVMDQKRFRRELGSDITLDVLLKLAQD